MKKINRYYRMMAKDESGNERRVIIGGDGNLCWENGDGGVPKEIYLNMSDDKTEGEFPAPIMDWLTRCTSKEHYKTSNIMISPEKMIAADGFWTFQLKMPTNAADSFFVAPPKAAPLDFDTADLKKSYAGLDTYMNDSEYIGEFYIPAQAMGHVRTALKAIKTINAKGVPRVSISKSTDNTMVLSTVSSDSHWTAGFSAEITGAALDQEWETTMFNASSMLDALALANQHAYITLKKHGDVNIVVASYENKQYKTPFYAIGMPFSDPWSKENPNGMIKRIVRKMMYAAGLAGASE